MTTTTPTQAKPSADRAAWKQFLGSKAATYVLPTLAIAVCLMLWEIVVKGTSNLKGARQLPWSS